MERKSFPLLRKSVDIKERIIEGYASTWDVDQVGDVITKGAFAKSVKERFPAGKIKVLWQHSDPLGMPVEMREDDTGLFVRAKISKTRLGDEALELMGDGVVDSMSIGFSTVQGKVDFTDVDGEPVRVLREVKLFEFSPVTFPANEMATINAVKSAELFDTLKRGGKLGAEDFQLLVKHIAELEALVKDALADSSREQHSKTESATIEPQAEKGIDPAVIDGFQSELDKLISWAKAR